MLIEFRVRNFRSFRGEAALSLLASNDSTYTDSHTTATGLDKLPAVLNWAAIYGPNASGKSNLLKAMQFMQAMVAQSTAIGPDTQNNLNPFRFAEDWINTPTLFEATFLIDGRRYQYGFEFTRMMIHEEWLLVYDSAKPQTWFSRQFDKRKKAYAYTYSDYFTGRKKVWEEATRKEVLLLSAAVQLNNQQLLPLYKALTEGLIVLIGNRVNFDYSAAFIQNPQQNRQMVDWLAAADTGIGAVKTEPRPVHNLNIDVLTGGNAVPPSVGQMDIPMFGHRLAEQEYFLELPDESQGTQIYFALGGPLLDILKKGSVLLVDELDASLHPLLVRRLVELFHTKETNPNGAQLLFTTHDVSLLDPDFARRDQVWFTEKDSEQVSHLYPLLDFSPRKGEALEKGYLTGRYGAVPMLRKLI